MAEVQEHISGTYSSLVSDTTNSEVKEQIKRYIRQYINENKITVTEMSTEELVDAED